MSRAALLLVQWWTTAYTCMPCWAAAHSRHLFKATISFRHSRIAHGQGCVVPHQGRRQVFVLHVGAAQSVGPDELRVMWATACDSLDTSVTRQMQGGAVGRPAMDSGWARHLIGAWPRPG